MDEVFLPIVIVGMLFIGFPWVVFHYITKWKTAATLTNEDEKMLSEMYETARKLEERLDTIERIVTADNPDYRPSRLTEDRSERLNLQDENIRTLERRG